MTDDVTTPPENSQDTAGTEDPTGTPSTTQDWQERYTHLQPEYTRATQEAARLREEKETSEQTAIAWQIIASEDDPERRRQAAEYLGLPVDEPEEPDDRLSAYEQKLQKMEERLSAREQAEQQAHEAEQYGTQIGQGVQALQEKEGLELSDPELATLYALCTVMEDENGQPKIQEAWDLFTQVGKAGSERILKGKRGAARPSTGVDASKKPDLSTREGRQAHMLERLAAEGD